LADEADCRTITAIFQEHDFGLMRVTQQGLVTRCIKHLIVSLDANSKSQTKNSMASIDSALRQLLAQDYQSYKRKEDV